MKSRSKVLCDHSLYMALSAIEIYNKPNFSNREQIFCILIVSAWESLLKAKLIKDSGNHMNSIYVKLNRTHYKRNRNGEYMTISISDAIDKVGLHETVKENLIKIIRVRDAAIHLTAESKSLPYLVFSLGTATLKNYATLLKNWFSLTLSDYNFYILPLGFSYPFKTMSLADFKREPEIISNIVKDIEKAKDSTTASDDYFLICEIETSLVSAKKITERTDITAKIDNNSDGSIIVNRKINLIDQYPYTYTQVYNKMKEKFPSLKKDDLNKLINDCNIKNNKTYASYNFRSKAEESKGHNKNTPVIYNNEFISYAENYFERTYHSPNEHPTAAMNEQRP